MINHIISSGNGDDFIKEGIETNIVITSPFSITLNDCTWSAQDFVTDAEVYNEN